MSKIFERVYVVVRNIPKGKVMTYGAVGKMAGVDPRVVGWALHANKNLQVPCHRVVNKEGRLAPGYAFGGPDEQKKRLLAEGVAFTPNDKVIFSW